MEQKNLIIAIALSIVVVVVYGIFFGPSSTPRMIPQNKEVAATQQPGAATSQPGTSETTGSSVAPASGQVDDVADIFAPGEKKPAVEEKIAAIAEDVKTDVVKDIKVETALYTAIFTNRGAGLKSLVLKKYYDDARKPLDLVSSKAGEFNLLPFYFSTFSGNEIFKRINSENFVIQGEPEVVVGAGENIELLFTYADTASNLSVTKKFVLGNSYIIDTHFEVQYNGEKLKNVPIVFGPDLENNIFKNRLGNELKIGGFDGSSMKDVNFAKLKTKPTPNKAYETERGNLAGFFHWVAYERAYFAAIFKRDKRDSPIEYYVIKPRASAKGKKIAEDKQIETAEEGKEKAAKKEEKYLDDQGLYYIIVSNPEQVYLGPKDEDILASVEHTFEQANKVIEYGWLGSIAKLILKGINFLYIYIPNYGWALVIFTIFLKILLFPLTYKSSESMAKMQTLQPKIKAIKKKYKNLKDPEQRRQMNMETMQLYKQEKVNPMGGCLPLLLQMPILFGIFNLLRTSINVRHEPWIFWIQDLSLKDPIYLLPILMGISQIIVQKMSPTTADANQKKMMYIMPVVITIFVMSLPSGLTLYWFVSNLLQIGQQHIINLKIYKEKREEERQKRALKRKKSKKKELN